MTDIIKTSCYLTLEPTFGYRGKKVTGARVSKATVNRPTTPIGAPVIHLKLELPRSILEPLQALLIVPESDVEIITAIVENDDDGESIYSSDN